MFVDTKKRDALASHHVKVQRKKEEDGTSLVTSFLFYFLGCRWLRLLCVFWRSVLRCIEQQQHVRETIILEIAEHFTVFYRFRAACDVFRLGWLGGVGFGAPPPFLFSLPSLLAPLALG
jgi:hypothetical protein